MPKPDPISVGEKNAAHILDLKPADFRSLVEEGVLPKPNDLGGFERWDVEQLRAIARGDCAEGGHIEW